MSGWELVGGDPAPGNPAQIRLRVGHLGRAEENLREVSRELGHIARQSGEANWKGAAAQAMHDTLEGFRYDLHPIADSFKGLATQMSYYANQLDELQGEARRALHRAEVAKANRERAEASRIRASAVLMQQRSALQSAVNDERVHAVSSVATTVLDPASSAANAQEAQVLAQRSAQARNATLESERQLKRLDEDVLNYKADLSDARRAAGDVRDEWDRLSNTTARLVDDSLHESLRNRSNLEKFLRQLGDHLGAISRFIKNPAPYLAELRGIIDKFSSWFGLLVIGLVLVAVVVAVIMALMLGGMPALALLLGTVGIWMKGAAVITIAAVAAKFVASAIVWGNHDRVASDKQVSTGTLFSEIAELVMRGILFFMPGFKPSNPAVKVGVDALGGHIEDEVIESGKSKVRRTIDEQGAGLKVCVPLP